MLGSHLTQETAAPLILPTLLRRRQLQLPLRDVLLCTPQPLSLAHVLREAQSCATPNQISLPSVSHLSKQRNSGLLADLPGFHPPVCASPALQIVALSAGQVTQQQQRRDDDVISIPLTLLEVSELYRAKHREQQPAQPGTAAAASSSSGAATALIEGRRVRSIQRESFDIFCSPASKDLVVVDTPCGSNADDQFLWEAFFIAECMLRDGGVLLAFSPHAFSQRMRHFLQWRFRSSHCVSCPDGENHYAVCSSLASDFGAVAVRRDDFPGFVARKQRRPRKWNPYRRAEARKFVMSVRPGFTNAPHTKDALLRNMTREKEREEQLRDADDAYFAVAHDMVEKGAHYSHPND